MCMKLYTKSGRITTITDNAKGRTLNIFLQINLHYDFNKTPHFRFVSMKLHRKCWCIRDWKGVQTDQNTSKQMQYNQSERE